MKHPHSAPRQPRQVYSGNEAVIVLLGSAVLIAAVCFAVLGLPAILRWVWG